MAGRLGNVKVASRNLKILKVDHDNNLILIRGAVPGHKGSLLKIFDSIKKKQDLSSLGSSQKAPILVKIIHSLLTILSQKLKLVML